MLESQLVMVKFLAVLNLLPSGLSTEFAQRPRNSSVKVGDSVTLPCSIADFDQSVPLKVQWAKDGFVFVDGSDRGVAPYAHMQLRGNELAGEYHLHIREVGMSDNGHFECQVGPRSEIPKGIRASAHLTVMVPPSNMSLNGVGVREGRRLEVSEGSSVSVDCTTTGARPAPTLAWYRNGKRIADGVSVSSTEGKSGLMETTATLTLAALSADHQSVFLCQAVHSALPPEAAMRANFTLNVLHAPGTPLILGYTEGDVLRAGQRLKLTCQADNGNPQMTLLWLRNGHRIDQDFLHQPTFTMNEYEFGVAAEDNEAEFRCEAANDVTTTPLSAAVKLKVYYGPSAVKIEGASEARMGGEVGLKCVTEPSYPTAKIDWIINGHPYHDATLIIRPVPGSGSISTSNITVKVPMGERLERSVTCIARNEKLEESRVSATHRLRVLYPPESLEILGYAGHPLVAGTRHTLTCLATGGNPSPKLTWFKGQRKINENIKTEIAGESMVGSELSLSPVAEDDNRALYRCEASSSALTEPLLAMTNLTVHFPPDVATISVKPSVLRAGKMGHLECESGGSNPAPVISWWLDGERLESVDVSNVTVRHGGFVVRNKLHLPLSASMDGQTYMCKAENPAISRGAAAAVQLKVLFPPAFDADAAQMVTVLENETVLLNYSAVGQPNDVKYTWYKGDKMMDESSLSLLVTTTVEWSSLRSSRVTRQDAGTYTLVASNKEGKTNLSTELTVNYPATIDHITSPIVVAVGDTAELACFVSAQPPVKKITWQREGFSFDGVGLSQEVRDLGPDEMKSELDSDFRKHIKVGVLRFSPVLSGMSGRFTCAASNGLGSAAVRAATFLVRAPPRLDRAPVYRRAAGALGKEGRLRCRASGVPDVQIRWRLIGKSDYIESGAHYSVLERKVDLLTYEGTLEIANMKEEDYTLYECVASNELGADKMEISLERAGPPSPPYKIFAHNVTADGVTVSWFPGFDGGLPQTFKIQYRKFGHSEASAKEQKVPRLPQESEHSFRLSGLEPLTRYELSVGAENTEGFTRYPDQPHVSIETQSPEGVGALGEMEEGLPTLVIILIVLVSVFLLLLNICLVLCLIRRQKRKKLKVYKKHVTIQSPEKAASARLMDAGGPRPVQMFGCQDPSQGLRPDSQYTTVGTDSGDDRNHNHSHGYSEDEGGSLRNVLERGGDGHVYLAERISPGSQQTYLLDDPYQALVPRHAPYANCDSPSNFMYADQLRQNSSLQRRTAGGGTLGRASGGVNYAAIQPEYGSTFNPEASGYDSEGPGILSYQPPFAFGPDASVMSSDAELPPAMGPLRHLQEAEIALSYAAAAPTHSPSRQGLPRRYSPPSSDSGMATLIQTSAGNGSAGAPFVAEVRPLTSSASNPPIMSTFGQPAPRAKAEYAELEHMGGDLV